MIIVDNVSFNSDEFNLKKQAINQFILSKRSEMDGLKTSVENAKNWLETYPNKSQFLLELLEQLQRPHIEFFNKLFTALKHDVLYSDMDKDDLSDKANKVLFKSLFKNDKMALKILATTPNGDEEQITSGGEKNVIATGLRLLALWRLISSESKQAHKSAFSHRNFAFMDEPDCWISNKALKQYVQLLNQIVHEFQQQLLLVTHHDVDLFKPFARVYKITNNGSFSEVELISEPAELKNSDVNNRQRIKRIQLSNFKTFKHLDIELSPYFTVFVGESMAGKSALMEAFNAIVNNEADDTLIRHHESKASVALTMVNEVKQIDENGDIKNIYPEYKVVWERIRKTTHDFTQKTRYRLFDSEGGMLHEEYNSSNVPSFVENALKMRKIDGIDIHLGSQENMNFLFSSHISDFDRAKILSLGKESAYINKMIETLNSQKRQYQSESKMLEKRYNQIHLVLQNTGLDSLIDPDNAIYMELRSNELELERTKLSCEMIDNLIIKLNFLLDTIDNYEKSKKSVDMYLSLLDEVDLDSKNLLSLSQCIEKLEILNNIQFATLNEDFGEILPEIEIQLNNQNKNLSQVGTLLKRWLVLNKANETLLPNELGKNLSLISLVQLLGEVQLNKFSQKNVHLNLLLEKLDKIEKLNVSLSKPNINLEELQNLCTQMDNLKSDLNKLTQFGKDLVKLEKQEMDGVLALTAAEEALERIYNFQEFIFGILPTCPTCGCNLSITTHSH